MNREKNRTRFLGVVALVLAPWVVGCGQSVSASSDSEDSEATASDGKLDLSAGSAPAPSKETRPKAASARPLDLKFDDVKFDMEKGARFERRMLTPKIEELASRRVRIRGYVHPYSANSEELRTFVFVRDNQACCFGPGAMLYDCMVVELDPKRPGKYVIGPITVEGTFAIVEDLDPTGVQGAIYRLTDASIR